MFGFKLHLVVSDQANSAFRLTPIKPSRCQVVPSSPNTSSASYSATRATSQAAFNTSSSRGYITEPIQYEKPLIPLSDSSSHYLQRAIIGSGTDQLKNISQIEHSFFCLSILNFCVNVLCGQFAYCHQPERSQHLDARQLERLLILTHVACLNISNSYDPPRRKIGYSLR